MKIIFLGTGTSGGIPELACDCEVCTSKDPKNKRTRSSLLIQNEAGNNLLIDTATDLRQQLLRENIWDIRHVLITHVHADHIFGLNDIRRFNQVNKTIINLYLKKEFDSEIRKAFSYIYNPPLQVGGGIPQIENQIIEPGKSFKIFDFVITPLLISHGRLPILGFRINDLAYITDCSEIPIQTRPYLDNLKILILNTLREKKHPTHFSLAESITEAKKIGAANTYFTHIAHNIDHQKINTTLPKGIELAYDGLTLRL